MCASVSRMPPGTVHCGEVQVARQVDAGRLDPRDGAAQQPDGLEVALGQQQLRVEAAVAQLHEGGDPAARQVQRPGDVRAVQLQRGDPARLARRAGQQQPGDDVGAHRAAVVPAALRRRVVPLRVAGAQVAGSALAEGVPHPLLGRAQVGGLFCHLGHGCPVPPVAPHPADAGRSRTRGRHPAVRSSGDHQTGTLLPAGPPDGRITSPSTTRLPVRAAVRGVSQRGARRRPVRRIPTLDSVISRIDLRGAAFATGLRDGRIDRDLLPRAELDVEAALETVRPICEDVRHRGTAALHRLRASASTASAVDRLRVPAEALAARAGRARPGGPRRAGGVDPPGPPRPPRPAPHRRTPPRSSPAARSPSAGCRSSGSGSTCRAACAVYPSSVVMNVVPAQEAGVASLAVASPPQAEFGGLPHPTILAACALLGVDEVYAVGGAQAIAMFAYGTERVPPGATWSPAPATSTSPRPSGCSRAGSASTPRPAPPRSPSSPTTPPTRCTSPPT